MTAAKTPAKPKAKAPADALTELVALLGLVDCAERPRVLAGAAAFYELAFELKDEGSDDR